MSKIRIESLDLLRSIEKLKAREGEKMKDCDVCGYVEEDVKLYPSGNIWLCSVHICEVCQEPGYARHRGTIYCDSCFVAEGEGFPCESCGSIEYIDHISGTICQGCEDRSIFGGSR